MNSLRIDNVTTTKQNTTALYEYLMGHIAHGYKMSGDPFTNTLLIPGWINNYIQYNVWDEIIYSF